MKKNKMLLQSFKFFVERNMLFTMDSKILLAVSGGVDSVVLLHLMKAIGMDFSVAHCNFQLRGKASDKDEKFVKDLCKKLKVPFHVRSFETEEFARENGVSIQMAARDLRYSWFNSLAKEYGFDIICTAHHADDNAETVLLNIARGTGLDGLTGIELKKGKLVRPLLFASKKQIRKFADQNDISFRKDKSNDEEYYKRNFVRRKIIPLFRKLNPSFENSFVRSIEYFKDAAELINTAVIEATPSIVKRNKNEVHISIPELSRFTSPSIFLHHFFRAEGLPLSNINEVLELMNAQAGKEVIIGEKRILRNRKSLIITDQDVKKDQQSVLIEESSGSITGPVSLKLESGKGIPGGKKDDRTLYVPIDKIEFPLRVRKWEAGDFIFPFGMKGKKKVSDLLIDKKVPLHKKENVCVLEDAQGRIVWVIGVRSDDRFKVSDPAAETLIVKLTDPDYL